MEPRTDPLSAPFLSNLHPPPSHRQTRVQAFLPPVHPRSSHMTARRHVLHPLATRPLRPTVDKPDFKSAARAAWDNAQAPCQWPLAVPAHAQRASHTHHQLRTLTLAMLHRRRGQCRVSPRLFPPQHRPLDLASISSVFSTIGGHI
ncbi:hypothetical protein OF83DRAFT_1120413 [Amylostereum chailletii]|nr:hypothetical protein OF83DRAFT_1120413 [Amylostereum chailletii]